MLPCLLASALVKIEQRLTRIACAACRRSCNPPAQEQSRVYLRCVAVAWCLHGPACAPLADRCLQMQSMRELRLRDDQRDGNGKELVRRLLGLRSLGRAR